MLIYSSNLRELWQRQVPSFRERPCDFNGLLTFGEDVAARQIEGRVLRIGTCQGEQILSVIAYTTWPMLPQ